MRKGLTQVAGRFYAYTETLYLTGSADSFIRYRSDASIIIGATAIKGATIASQKVVCGSKSLTADGTISNVESGKFVFTVYDSRGNYTITTVEKTFIEYVNLTCNIKPTITVDGNASIAITGNYFNGSFGAYANSLAILYRYKVADGEYGDWQTATSELSDTTYSANVEFDLPDFDYKTAYTFQARAIDLLNTIDSVEYKTTALPVFDWSEGDFNFNVPVYQNSTSRIYAEEVLFDGDSPNAITLSLGAENFTYIDIFYADNNGRGSGFTRVYQPDGKEVHLDLIEPIATSATYIRRTVYTISSTTITPEMTTAAYMYYNGASWNYSAGNYIKIQRVTGFR